MPGGVYFIDRWSTEFDALGVNLTVGSGSSVRHERWTHALWRRHLECELRKLNEWDAAHRAEYGRIIPLRREAGH